LVILCIIVIGSSILFLNRQKNAPAPAPVAESSPQMAQMPPEKVAAPKQELQPVASQNTNQSAQVPTSTPTTDEVKSDDSTNSIHKLVDALLTAKSGDQKQALFDQLRKAGQLDAVIAELKQRMADNPNDPEIPTTLGEAQLNELRAIRDAGGDYSQIGILALQADQSFNAALKIDPQNWEAQFVKAASMYRWPANPQTDNEAVQRLSDLIDQQGTMTPQPELAQTYVVLGEEYQKIGQPDKAEATWQIGLQKFPSDSTLQKKISGQ
jgi:tetratricopeptide (TPR) repeat protein